MQVWDDEECVRSLEAHKAVVSALACDQSWLYSGSWDGFIKVLFSIKILNVHPDTLVCGCIVDPIKNQVFVLLTSLGGQGMEVMYATRVMLLIFAGVATPRYFDWCYYSRGKGDSWVIS